MVEQNQLQRQMCMKYIYSFDVKRVNQGLGTFVTIVLEQPGQAGRRGGGGGWRAWRWRAIRGCTRRACRRRTRCFSEIETFPFFGPNILPRRWLETISKGKLCECSPSNSCLQCSSPLQGRKPGQEDFEVGFIHWWFYTLVILYLCGFMPLWFYILVVLYLWGFLSLWFSIFVVLDCIDNTSNGDKITSDVKGAHPRIMIV